MKKIITLAFLVVLLATPLVILADHDPAHTIQQLREQIEDLQAKLPRFGGGAGGASAPFVILPPGGGYSVITFLAGKTGEYFSASFEAVDGKAPFKWSIAKGSLPPGLTLSSPGSLGPISLRCRLLQDCPISFRTILLTGYPRQVGNYQFELRVKDKDGNVGSGEFAFFAAERVLRNYIKIAPQPKASLAASFVPRAVLPVLIPAATGVTLAQYKLDAAVSEQDILVNSLKLRDTYAGNPGASDILSCQLFDGASALNTGANIVNPLLDGASPDDAYFRLDSPLLVPKGTSKTIDLKCSVAIDAVGGSSHAWGINAEVADAVVANGALTGVLVKADITSAVGQTLPVTVGQGTFSVSLDSSSPLERFGIAGSNDVLMANLKLHADLEDIQLKQIGLVLSGAGASARDIRKVTLWDGSTKVGETVFWEGNNRATAVLSSGFSVPKDGDKFLTIKADLADVGVLGLGTTGHQVAVNYDGTNVDSTYGIGQSSANVIHPLPGSDTAGQGVRLVKTAPRVEFVPLLSHELADGSGITLYRFNLSAGSSGGAGLYKLSFKISSVDAKVANLSLHAYTDPGFSIPAYGIDSALNRTPVASPDPSGFVEIYFGPVGGGANEAIQIPAGEFRYFELRGDTSETKTRSVVDTKLEGDSAYFAGGFTGTADAVDGDANDDFIWSPNTSMVAAPDTSDWLNSFLVTGLPAAGTVSQTLVRNY